MALFDKIMHIKNNIEKRISYTRFVSKKQHIYTKFIHIFLEFQESGNFTNTSLEERE